MNRHFEWSILISMLCIFGIGLLTLYSATHSYALLAKQDFVIRQIIWMAIALALLLITINIDYHGILNVGLFLYVLNLILLGLVLVLGHVRYGAQRWFSIGDFTIQPAEFIKITLIMVLASYLGHKKDSLDNPRQLIVPFLLTLIPMGLIVIQPDLGTALMLFPILFAMLYVAGVPLKHLVTIIACGALASPFAWNMLRTYQKQRLLVFLNPNIDPLGAGYTIIQSKIAIGSGGLFGKGWLAGTQNQLNFLPERHTDFIFSVIGEEWGFFGGIILVLLYFWLVKRGIEIVYKTDDPFGRLLVTGIVTMLSFQTIINIGMTTGLMPVVGLPLPLVSYGGSSLLTTVFSIALILNVGMRR